MAVVWTPSGRLRRPVPGRWHWQWSQRQRSRLEKEGHALLPQDFGRDAPSNQNRTDLREDEVGALEPE